MRNRITSKRDKHTRYLPHKDGQPGTRPGSGVILEIDKDIGGRRFRRDYHPERNDNGHESKDPASGEDAFRKREVAGAEGVEGDNDHDRDDREESSGPSSRGVVRVVDDEESLNDV